MVNLETAFVEASLRDFVESMGWEPLLYPDQHHQARKRKRKEDGKPPKEERPTRLPSRSQQLSRSVQT